MRRIKALIDGEWYGDLGETEFVQARLAHGSNRFRGRVTPGDAGGEFPAEPGRYHLYVSYACPWAHRTILYRTLKRLEDVVPMSVLHPRWSGAGGWRFGASAFSTVDHVGERKYLYEVYRAARPDFTGRVTVPVLWDRRQQTIVSDDSHAIMRMFNTAFDAWGERSVDFYPPALRARIDELNAWVLTDVCQGVYKAGFARSQADYERAARTLFERLDELDVRLAHQPFLLGNSPTESDWHLFSTLCRFDAAYHGALKCNLRRLTDYPALSAYTRRLHRWPGVAHTVRIDQIKRHYYDALGEIDPTIVPLGPAQDYRARAVALPRAARGRCARTAPVG